MSSIPWSWPLPSEMTAVCPSCTETAKTCPTSDSEVLHGVGLNESGSKISEKGMDPGNEEEVKTMGSGKSGVEERGGKQSDRKESLV